MAKIQIKDVFTGRLTKIFVAVGSVIGLAFSFIAGLFIGGKRKKSPHFYIEKDE